MDDGSATVIGDIVLYETGDLDGKILNEDTVKRILDSAAGEFVLTPFEDVATNDVIKNIEDAWGNARERAWNLAAVLVGSIIQEHDLRDRCVQHSILLNGFHESALEQHIQLIRDLADWLLEE